MQCPEKTIETTIMSIETSFYHEVEKEDSHNINEVIRIFKNSAEAMPIKQKNVKSSATT